jgi:hypothetical protein
MSMWRRISSLLIVFLVFQSAAQEKEPWIKNPFQRKQLELNVTKTGSYFGLQQGRYLVGEFGVERQWDRIRLTTKKTHALHGGFNYNIKYKILGYDVGYWYRGSRLGLTWGGNICVRTDFDNTRVGIVPVVGYKVWQFHVQTGYHFLTPLPEEHRFETNGLFINIRFVMIADKERELKRNEKTKKKPLFGS